MYFIIKLKPSSLELPDISDPQKLGSCITYFRRYTLVSLLGLMAEDDDGNLVKGKRYTENSSCVTTETFTVLLIICFKEIMLSVKEVYTSYS